MLVLFVYLDPYTEGDVIERRECLIAQGEIHGERAAG